jgi:predicted esterase
MQESCKIVADLVHDEMELGIPGDRIILGGMSQGGALALYSSLTLGMKIGGILGLSTWLPLQDKIKEDYKEFNNRHQC